jgi:uncharacterized lipoprotein YajG
MLMKMLFAVAALALLAGCMASRNQCVQPDALEPQTEVFNKGMNAGEPLKPFNKSASAAE